MIWRRSRHTTTRELLTTPTSKWNTRSATMQAHYRLSFPAALRRMSSSACRRPGRSISRTIARSADTVEAAGAAVAGRGGYFYAEFSQPVTSSEVLDQPAASTRGPPTGCGQRTRNHGGLFARHEPTDRDSRRHFGISASIRHAATSRAKSRHGTSIGPGRHVREPPGIRRWARSL